MWIMRLMKVKESKTKLAKLLATENIEVRQTKSNTATFDVKNRILTLPMWDFKDTDFLDYIIGHEVSHAKNTPVELLDRWNNEVGAQYFDALNVTEDIRIERKIQEQFPGLIRSFRNGRKGLLDDVIELPADLSSMKKIDKVNLHAKCGEHIDVPMTDEEKDFYDRCYAAETPEEAFDLAKELVSSIKKDQENQQNEDHGNGDDQGQEEEVTGSPSDAEGEGEQQDGDEQDSSSSGEGQEGETDDSAEKQDGDDQGEEEVAGSSAEADKNQKEGDDSSANDGAGDSGSNLEDFKSDTLKQMENHLEENIDHTAEKLIYVPSDKRLLNMVHSYEKVKESRHEYQQINPHIKESFLSPKKRQAFAVFKKKQEKQIQYLTTQFERKKAAYQYQRATVSRNGRLNTNSLHRYKIDDDIFQSVTNLANAKDHGMVMVVDYSASMNAYMQEVVEQTLNMVWFCKKVGIPFEVYGFTSGARTNPSDAGEKNELNFSFTNVFELVNSRMKKGEFEEACFRFWAPASGGYFRTQSIIEQMHGTPLDSTIVISAAIIRRFQKTHRIQKTIALFLTDGESSRVHPPGPYTVDFGSGVRGKGYATTPKLFEALREEVDITLVGYRIGHSRDFTNQLWRLGGLSLVENLKKSLRKEGFAHISNSLGYDHYFMMNSARLEIEDDELDLGSDTFDAADKKSVRDLMKKFKNSTKNRKDSRRFLNVFSDIIS